MHFILTFAQFLEGLRYIGPCTQALMIDQMCDNYYVDCTAVPMGIVYQEVRFPICVQSSDDTVYSHLMTQCTRPWFESASIFVTYFLEEISLINRTINKYYIMVR